MNHSGQSAEAETSSLHGFFWPSLWIHIFLAFKASVIGYFSFLQCEGIRGQPRNSHPGAGE